MKQGGLTLVEIVISMLILSLVLLGIAGIFVVGKRYLMGAQYRQEALHFAREKIEELEAFDFDHANLFAGAYTETLTNGWERAWSIVDEDLDLDSSADRKNIIVTVQWQEP